MGSGYTIGLEPEQYGIIPRVIRLIFQEVEKRKKKSEFIIKCSFLEIYNEELHDLLDANSLQQVAANQETTPNALYKTLQRIRKGLRKCIDLKIAEGVA